MDSSNQNDSQVIRYVLKFGLNADGQETALTGRFHCAGLPNDPSDIENAMLMSPKALDVFLKSNRFIRAGHQYQLLTFNLVQQD